MDEMLTIELTIELPDVNKPEDLLILQILLMTIEGVEDAGTFDDTADWEKLGLWVQVGSRVLAGAKTAAPLIKRIVSLVQEQGSKGAKLRVGKNTIDIDQVSTDQIEELVAAWTTVYSPQN